MVSKAFCVENIDLVFRVVIFRIYFIQLHAADGTLFWRLYKGQNLENIVNWMVYVVNWQ